MQKKHNMVAQKHDLELEGWPQIRDNQMQYLRNRDVKPSFY